MQRAWSVIATVVVVAGLSACGGPNGNIEACTTFVQQANAAIVECGGEPLYTVADTCPDSIGTGPDCTAYYECLGNGYSCTTETMTLSASIGRCSCGG